MRKQFTYTLDDGGVDRNAPLIYMWEIANTAGTITGRYVGKASGGETRPARHYRRRVESLLDGKPYGKGRPYRRIHRALADAVFHDHAVSLRFLCNVPEDVDIFEVESAYICQYRCDVDDGVGLNGRPRSEGSTLGPVPLPTSFDGTVCPADDDEQVDLEDFADCVAQQYAGRFRVTAGPGRYSLWLGKERVVRARQRSQEGKVRIKLAQTSKRGVPSEFTWSGSEQELIRAIDGQIELIGEP